MILTVIERMRGYLDEAILDAKYDNSYLARHIISPCLAEVIGRINMTSDETVVLRYSLTLIPGTEYYTLPPFIGQVHSLCTLNSHGEVIDEYTPRSRHHLAGPGWTLEGNLLTTRPQVIEQKDMDLWYTPSGEFLPHYSEDGGTLNADLDELTLDMAPTYGGVERRMQAYGGQILRLLPDSPNVIEERVIAEHDADATTVTVRVPFAHNAAGGSKAYEIAPAGSQSLYEAIAVRGALKLAAYRNVPDTHYRKLQNEYKGAIKSVRDRLSNLQGKTGKYLEKATVDNPDAGLIRLA